MKARIFKYSLPIEHPTLTTREGLLLQLEDGPENSGWGEIAPYPGLNQENIEEALSQLLQFAATPMSDQSKDISLFPSVSFGLQSALSDLFWDTTDAASIPISAFLMGSPEKILERAEQFHKQGFRFAKIKLADKTIEEARDILRSLQNRFFLRVDLNRKWPLEKTVQLASAFDPALFDYFEEPVDNLSDLVRFPFPFALDESLSPNLFSLPHLKALIVKPTVHGGYSPCKRILSFTQERNIQCILGSSFESGIGLLQIARLAEKLGLSTHPHGLGTVCHFPNDLLAEPLAIQNGSILLKKPKPKEGIAQLAFEAKFDDFRPDLVSAQIGILA